MDATAIARIVRWIVFPLAGIVWTATCYPGNWYYYDDGR